MLVTRLFAIAMACLIFAGCNTEQDAFNLGQFPKITVVSNTSSLNARDKSPSKKNTQPARRGDVISLGLLRDDERL